MNIKRCIILANGKPPAKKVIEFLKKKGYSAIICADGGANTAYRLGIIPDYIIGDLDSSDKKVLKYFSKHSKIIRIKRQNDTDVEKCLKFAIKKNFGEAVLAGVTGDRLDHTFCNLGIVLKFYDRISLRIIAEKSILTAHTGDIQLETSKGEIISLYGFNERTKIISKGLKYPLNNTALPFGRKESTSNVAVSRKVELKIRGGKIFVIRDFDRVRKDGHF